MEWKVQFRGEIADESFVSIGIGAAEMVIDVKDSGCCTEFMERGQEENGIGSAGNGNTDTLLFTNGECDLIDHILILRGMMRIG